jgi:hypothetical protein
MAGLLAGCGGGGNGYTAPMPTITISSPATATSINFGQGLQLTWTTANATSCSASASSNEAGTFTGTQPMSGSVTVVPMAPGSYTYTLSCMGGGGTAMASTPVITVGQSILATLAPPTGKIATIGPTGSTTDPAQGYNPYGLVIAPTTAGLITAGDLVVCNFNQGGSHNQGSGMNIVGLHPTAGSTPYPIAHSASLTGCNALTMLADDSISAAAWLTPNGPNGENPLVSATGVVATPFATDTFAKPWGEAHAPATSAQPAAIYVSNAPATASDGAGGSIDRISLSNDAQSSFTEIANGFCSSGTPGALFGPSGLTYDPNTDTLYVVDSSSNSVVAFSNVSSIGKDGVVVNGQCTSGTPPAPIVPPTPTPTFSGPSASSARVIAHGGAFNAPISAALLSDGNLLVSNGDLLNTASIPVAMQNLLFEVSPVLPGGFVGQPVQLDGSGTAAALFGLVATVDAQGNTLIYFNDDNTNSVMVLSK